MAVRSHPEVTLQRGSCGGTPARRHEITAVERMMKSGLRRFHARNAIRTAEVSGTPRTGQGILNCGPTCRRHRLPGRTTSFSPFCGKVTPALFSGHRLVIGDSLMLGSTSTRNPCCGHTTA